jgi:hypothetical protein
MSEMNEMNDDPKPEDPVPMTPGTDALEAPMESDMEAKLKVYKGTARLGQDIQAKIGQHLRAMYADIVDQGIPDRFADLIRRKAEEHQKKGKE